MFKFKTSKHNLPHDGIFRKAALRTLARVTRSAEAFAIKQIKSQYNVPREQLNKNIVIHGGSVSKLTRWIYVYSKGIALMEFKGRGSWKRARAAVVKGQSKIIPGGFVATMKSGHQGIFRRRGYPANTQKVVPGQGRYAGRTASRGPRKGQAIMRQPIDEAMSFMTAPRMFLAKRVMPELEKHIAERIAIEYPHQLQYLTRTKVAT